MTAGRAPQIVSHVLKRPARTLVIAVAITVVLTVLGRWSFSPRLIYGGIVIEGNGKAKALMVYGWLCGGSIEVSTIGKDAVSWSKDISVSGYEMLVRRWSVDGRWTIDRLLAAWPNTASIYYKFMGWPLRWLCVDESGYHAIDGIVGGIRLRSLRLVAFPGRLAFNFIVIWLLLLMMRALKLILPGRRGGEHLCQGCSYDTSGVSVCPECGRPVGPASAG